MTLRPTELNGNIVNALNRSGNKYFDNDNVKEVFLVFPEVAQQINRRMVIMITILTAVISNCVEYDNNYYCDNEVVGQIDRIAVEWPNRLEQCDTIEGILVILTSAVLHPAKPF